MGEKPDMYGKPGQGKIVFVLKGYPRLSETFIAQEILALEKRGLEILIYSLRHPTDKAIHDLNKQISAPVSYLPEYLYQEPKRVFRAWASVRRLPGYKKARDVWQRDLVRDPTPNRIRRFGQAMVLAAEAPDAVRQMHAHFIHTPGSVTRYAALIRELPWSVSAHAKDIWTLPDWELSEKIRDCKWAVTCTAVNSRHMSDFSDRDNVSLVYHGLDFDRFPVTERSYSELEAGSSVQILSVGRAVVKKGYDQLLIALAAIPETHDWKFIHIGGGPLLDKLKAQASELGISGRIEWRGAQAQHEVIKACQNADIFVLASLIAEDGDRDGLPNVLMEAQSLGLPCISTTVSAIPELITDQVSGLLVPPSSPLDMADALIKLCERSDLRKQYGETGMKNVRSNFKMDSGINLLMTKFTEELAQQAAE